ncbi:class I adenylate-forming enzyme family protein [Saccharothrix syringae]|uniref:Acyl-CoA synthetase n=1 Tax=Saccharothrix syringae TaxID=103733 RepID=A0A5Q0GUL6_SACSY|nr:AMP-binding protein [Saccharothrix syringae]QFZ17796.1 acyl-CoA synthetase [Saccharothrix syringae]
MNEVPTFCIGEMFDQAAAAHGAATIVLDAPLQFAPEDGTTLTLARVAEHVRTLSARLKAAGVRRGDRVALYKTDNFDIALLAASVQRLGAVPALLSPALGAEVVAALLERLERPWLLTDRAKLDASGLDTSGARAVLLSAGEGTGDWSPLARFDGPVGPPTPPDRFDPALITHTSGTTGLPKLVVQTPDALGERLRPQKVVARRTWRHERVALCMSFVHARFYSALYLGLSYGNTLVVAVDPDPDRIGPLFTRTRPGAVETQPNTFVDWEALADAPGAPLSSVRYYSATFDAMHPRTIRVLLGASRRRRPYFVQLYGQTETGPVTANLYSARGAHRADGRCVGWAFPGVVRLRVVGDDGREAPAGRVGHIEVKSRTRAITYLGEDDRFRAQLTDGWWRMGDLGSKDRWGRVRLYDREVDRVDDVDSNLRVEDELMSRLPELREVVIVAGEGGRALPVVCTRGDVELDPGRWSRATADLPPMAPPRRIPFDRVPRTATWKVRRPELVRSLRDGVYD